MATIWAPVHPAVASPLLCVLARSCARATRSDGDICCYPNTSSCRLERKAPGSTEKRNSSHSHLRFVRFPATRALRVAAFLARPCKLAQRYACKGLAPPLFRSLCKSFVLISRQRSSIKPKAINCFCLSSSRDHRTQEGDQRTDDTLHPSNEYRPRRHLHLQIVRQSVRQGLRRLCSLRILTNATNSAFANRTRDKPRMHNYASLIAGS